jgi:hypothetical protein
MSASVSAESGTFHRKKERKTTMSKKYFYYITDQQENEDDAREIESVLDEDDCGIIAEDAAEHEWNHNDGWEWMSGGVDELVLLSEDKKEIGRFSIRFEAEPTFWASKNE